MSIRCVFRPTLLKHKTSKVMNHFADLGIHFLHLNFFSSKFSSWVEKSSTFHIWGEGLPDELD